MKVLLAIFSVLSIFSASAEYTCDQANLVLRAGRTAQANGELILRDDLAYIAYHSELGGLMMDFTEKANSSVYFKVNRDFCNPITCLLPTSILGYKVIKVEKFQNETIASVGYIESKGRKLSKNKIIELSDTQRFRVSHEVSFNSCN